MLREAKEDFTSGIYIRFRTDGSVFNLRRLLAHTNTLEVMILELLFADDCALLTHSEEALQAIVDRFAEARLLRPSALNHLKEPTTLHISTLIEHRLTQSSSSPTLGVSSQLMLQ